MKSCEVKVDKGGLHHLFLETFEPPLIFNKEITTQNRNDVGLMGRLERRSLKDVFLLRICDRAAFLILRARGCISRLVFICCNSSAMVADLDLRLSPMNYNI